MGVKDLSKLLKKHCPDKFHKINDLSVYEKEVDEERDGQNLRFVIDIGGFLYRFAYYREGPEDVRFLHRFVEQHAKLKACKIDALYVFDGPQAWDAKKKELEKRQKERERTAERIEERVAELVEKKAEVNGSAIFILNRKRKQIESELAQVSAVAETDLEVEKKKQRLAEELQEIQKKKDSIPALSTDQVQEELEKIQEKIVSTQRQNISVTFDDKQLLLDLFRQYEVPHVVAKGEGERACVWLVKHGYGDVVVSDDYDALALGAPRLLRNFDAKRDTEELRFAEVLQGLEVTEEQFREICVLSGCDFFERWPGLGPLTAYKHVKEFGSMTKFLESTKAAKYRSNEKLMKTYNEEWETACYHMKVHSQERMDDEIFVPFPSLSENEEGKGPDPWTFFKSDESHDLVQIFRKIAKSNN